MLESLTQSVQVAIRVEKGREHAPRKFLGLLLEYNAVIPHPLKCGLYFLAGKNDGRLPLGPIVHHRSRIDDQAGFGARRSNFDPSRVRAYLVLVVHDKADLLDPEAQRLILVADVYGRRS